MRKKVAASLCILLLIGAMTSTGSAQTEFVAADGNRFALGLYGRLAEKGGNLFFSPASIHTALAMAYAGAKDRTAKQMAEVLLFDQTGQDIHTEFQSLLQRLNAPRMVKSYEQVGTRIALVEKPAYELVIANALWGQKDYSWDQAFLDLTASRYGAGLREVDFVKQPEEARKTINGWVEAQTRARIKELIAKGAISPLMRLILTNAIYFKAAWNNPFADHATRDMPFHASGSNPVTVSMMTQKEDFRYLETDNFQALQMPYKADALAMIVFLPRAVDGMRGFEKSLTAARLDTWMKAFSVEEVDVFFPKFEFTSSFSLSGILRAMGMADAFSPDAADFSGMTAAERIFISEVIHKAFVAVDEKGTTAAAATAVMMAATAMPTPKPDPKVFKADHPFWFCIRHNPTGKIVFMGRFSDPQPS